MGQTDPRKSDDELEKYVTTRLFTLLLTLFVLVGETFAAQITEIRYQNWVGGAFTDDDTGLFSHCVVYTDFQHGGWLYIGVMANGFIGLGFSNDSWSLSTDQEIEGSIQVDDRYLKPFSSEPISSTLFYAYFASSDPIFAAVRRGRTLTLEFDNERVPHDLTGTARALDLVKGCVEDQKLKEKKSSSSGSSNAALNLWIAENPWFMEPEDNKIRHTKALEINQLLLSEGWDPSKLAFYAELDRRLDLAMRDKTPKRAKQLADFFEND